MFAYIYAVVQVALDYLPILLIPWILSAATTALLLRGWECDRWYLCLIPAIHTPMKVYYVTGNKLVFLSVILCYVSLFTRSTVLCLLYLLLVCVYNTYFTVNTFVLQYRVFAIFGVYRTILFWKEIRECQICNKAKSTKKKRTTRKTEKKPSTKTRKPS